MIHVAPCSCELHVRIRELEADYRHENEGRRAIETLYTEQKARAENAEAAVAWLQSSLAERKARVAELAAEVAHLEGVISEREAD